MSARAAVGATVWMTVCERDHLNHELSADRRRQDGSPGAFGRAVWMTACGRSTTSLSPWSPHGSPFDIVGAMMPTLFVKQRRQYDLDAGSE
jgi:hypothetical protein